MLLKDPNCRAKLSLMAETVCVCLENPTGADCTLFRASYKYIYGSFYSHLQTGLWDTHTLFTLRLVKWMGVRLASHMEDADGGRIIDTCFRELWEVRSRSWLAHFVQLGAKVHCAFTRRWIQRFVISLTLLLWVTLQMYMLQTSFLSSKRGGKKINCLNIVSCNCQLLCCQSNNTVNWPLLNLSQHCLAAVLSQTSYCFCFWGFSHARPVAVEGLSNTTRLTSHSELWLCCEASGSLHIFVRITGSAQTLTSAHVYVLVSARRDLCVCSYLQFKTSCWRPRNTGWRELEGAQERRAEQTRVQDFKWKLFQTRVPSAFTLESES